MNKKNFSVENCADPLGMKIRLAHSVGKSVQQIASELDVKNDIVEEKLLDMGLRPIWNVKEAAEDKKRTKKAAINDTKTGVFVPKSGKRKETVTLTDEQKKAVVDDYLGGMSRTQVCDKYYISQTTLNRIIVKFDAHKRKTVETAETTKKEPASVGAETSSLPEESDKTSQFDYTPDLRICQANLESISDSILEMYSGFSEAEKSAFDLGTIFRQVCDTHRIVAKIVFKAVIPNDP